MVRPERERERAGVKEGKKTSGGRGGVGCRGNVAVPPPVTHTDVWGGGEEQEEGEGAERESGEGHRTHLGGGAEEWEGGGG